MPDAAMSYAAGDCRNRRKPALGKEAVCLMEQRSARIPTVLAEPTRNIAACNASPWKRFPISSASAGTQAVKGKSIPAAETSNSAAHNPACIHESAGFAAARFLVFTGFAFRDAIGFTMVAGG